MIASIARPGSSAVQASETPYVVVRSSSCPGAGAVRPAAWTAPTTSESSGPCGVSRTVIVTGVPPATSMVSRRVVIGFIALPDSTWLIEFTRSR